MIKLGVNIDHIATLRNARGGVYPRPERALSIIKDVGADYVTVHLREDRRHINDDDLKLIVEANVVPVNMEMAMTYEMLDIALELRPWYVCIVPEKREERTTESGLNVVRYVDELKYFVSKLHDCGIGVSLFIDADEAQVRASKEAGVDAVEIHTGLYAELFERGCEFDEVFARIAKCVKLTCDLGLKCNAGHGLNYENVGNIAGIVGISELNIGHFLVGEAVFVGLEGSIRKMLELIKTGVQ